MDNKGTEVIHESYELSVKQEKQYYSSKGLNRKKLSFFFFQIRKIYVFEKDDLEFFLLMVDTVL